MRKLFLTLLISAFTLPALAQNKTKVDTPDPNKKIDTVQAACGGCQFGMKGKGCELAVRIDGKSYFVDGTDIDSHGDAHAKDGFCEAMRKAAVQGEVVNGRYKVTYFKLVDPIKN